MTLRFPPVRRHVTSPLCFLAQEDLSKNVFLFKGSQQPSFLLCLAALCVCMCVCVCLYISDTRYSFTPPKKTGTVEMQMRMLKGVYFPAWSVPIYSQGSCFITHSGCGEVQMLGTCTLPHTLFRVTHTHTLSNMMYLPHCSIHLCTQ